jgi:hypothetical protein
MVPAASRQPPAVNFKSTQHQPRRANRRYQPPAVSRQQLPTAHCQLSTAFSRQPSVSDALNVVPLTVGGGFLFDRSAEPDQHGGNFPAFLDPAFADVLIYISSVDSNVDLGSDLAARASSDREVADFVRS